MSRPTRAWVATPVLALALSGSAHAAERLYAEFIAGKRFVAETSFVVDGVSSKADVGGFGIGGSGAFGYRWQDPFGHAIDMRFELEGGHAENEPDTLTARGALADRIGGAREVGIDGNVKSTWAMANIWFDKTLGRAWVATMGGGLGIVRLDYNKLDADGGQFLLIHDETNVFAYQIGVGLGYRFTPRLTLSAHYRYLDTEDPSFESEVGKLDTEFETHNVFLGLRYFFY